MTILERIQELCSDYKTNISKLETELNLGKGTIYKWKESSPNTDKIAKVAGYFNVSLDYLLGRTDIPTQTCLDDFDSAYFKVMKEAQDEGMSAHDVSIAISFLKKARERDEK